METQDFSFWNTIKKAKKSYATSVPFYLYDLKLIESLNIHQNNIIHRRGPGGGGAWLPLTQRGGNQASSLKHRYLQVLVKGGK